MGTKRRAYRSGWRLEAVRLSESVMAKEIPDAGLAGLTSGIRGVAVGGVILPVALLLRCRLLRLTGLSLLRISHSTQLSH